MSVMALILSASLVTEDSGCMVIGLIGSWTVGTTTLSYYSLRVRRLFLAVAVYRELNESKIIKGITICYLHLPFIMYFRQDP